jgi:nitrate reductase beta subunit
MDGGGIGRVMAHVAVVMNPDRCIGCPACSPGGDAARPGRAGADRARSDDGEIRLRQWCRESRTRRRAPLGRPHRVSHFERVSARAEKCALCHPCLEAVPPAACAEKRTGGLRQLGVVLYDVSRVGEVPASQGEQDLYAAQLEVFLDPQDPEVQAAARRDGLPDRWLESAKRSPVYLLAKEFRVALPLRPEYRTMPMVWYLPPLSPLVDTLASTGCDGEDAHGLFSAIERLSVPVEHLAELFTAGDTAPVTRTLRRLAAMRSHMRRLDLGEAPDESIAAAVGMTCADIERMHRLLAQAKHDERHRIPTAYGVDEADRRVIDEIGCTLDFTRGPDMCGSSPSGESAG